MPANREDKLPALEPTLIKEHQQGADLRDQILRGAQRYGPLIEPKLHVIDYAFRRFKIRSFADLGAAYRVDGGYTFYAVDCCGAERAILVDTHPTALTLSRAAERGNVQILRGNFGDAEVATKVGEVDAVIFFDVLLHQVAPDWDQLLTMYASRTRIFIIHNPQWLGPETIRLLDLGEEKYLATIPKTRNEAVYRAALDRPNEIQPEHGRPNRDLHHIWQWGITDEAMIVKLRSLGFALRYFQDHGYFWDLDAFRNHSFVFEKGS